MPLFRYTLVRGEETKVAELRRSNPQGWLLEAVTATFPDVASRRGGDVMRLRLQVVDGAEQTWRATMIDEPADLRIEVTRKRR